MKAATDINYDKPGGNYSDAVIERLAQISIESRPGNKSGVLPGMENATYEQLLEYHAAIRQALMDEN